MVCYRLLAISLLLIATKSVCAGDLFNVSEWQSDKKYLQYDTAVFGQKLYFLKQVELEGEERSMQLWFHIDHNVQSLAWNKEKTYQQGNTVLHQGKVYAALWKASSFSPDSENAQDSWLLLGEADLKGPTAKQIMPVQGVITSAREPIVIEISDPHISVLISNYKIKLNPSQDVVLNWDKNVNPKRLIITPTYDWVDGPLEFTISMLDRYGNENQESFQFEVEVNVSIRSIPSALPSKGEAPLSVTFTPTVKTDSAINLYRWDFNGDGQYERTDTVGRNQNHTFTHPGAYRASLEITDSAGRKDVGLVQVNVKNGKPVVTASVDKTNGRVPLTVNFSSNATDNEGIESVEWDFDGDGSVDYHHSSAGKTSYVYETPGSYQAKVIVTDKLGASTQLGLPNIEIRAAEPDAPEVMLNINKTSGKAPLSVVLSASFTHDKSVTVERMLWDFDGDGLTDATDGQAQSWVYRSAGTFYPSVTLVTSDGKSAKDVRKLAVQEQLTLTVEGSTLDPDAFDLATIHTTLNADMDVSLVIEDSHGAPVRTLVSWVKRGAGDYADKWDGSSNLGQILPQGDYYAVLKYRRDGQEYRLDLRPSTSGGAYNPRRNYIPSRFQPYDSNPLTITFTLPYPSEVTSFMGLYNTNTRLVTFSNREPLGAGTHTIVWNGIGDDGKPVKATSSNPFLFGIWGYKSGDNAIYIASGPKLSGFSANPAIAVPETHTDASDGHSHLQFTLTKPADIELVVSDNDTGLVVRRHIYQGAIKGEQNLRWDLKSDDGKLVSAGKYRLGLRAIDAKGFTSPYLYTVQRVYY